MPTSLSKGGNVSLTKEDPNLRRVLVGLGWDTHAAGGGEFDLDASAFLLTSSGKVRNDEDFIFYNQPESPDRSVKHSGDNRTGAGEGDDEQMFVTLADVAPAIERIAFAVTIHEAESRRQNFGRVSNAYIRIVNDETRNEIARYQLTQEAGSETAMIFGELYRRYDEWKFRAVGQGFDGGLGPLAMSFGVDVEGPPAPTPPASDPPSDPTPPPVVNPAPAMPGDLRPPAPAAVNLSKITIEKRGQSVSLEKKGAGFGEIVVNLNWSRKAGEGMFGKSQAVDLDLCCLFELADGRKGGVQALGDNYGDLHGPPFMRLDGDDRTGDVTEGEFLRINGQQWNAIRRVLVFAFIYEGVPNWSEAQGVVTVKVPGEPDLEVKLDSPNVGLGTCGIATLENIDGGIRVTKLVDYFGSNSEMDRANNFGLRWAAGSKE